MDCRDARNLLHPFVDGELDLVRHLQIEHHLADCSECAEQERSLRQLLGALASPPLYHRAPGTLRARIQAALAPASEPASASQGQPRRPRKRPSAVLIAIAAALVLATAALVAGGVAGRSTADRDRLAEEVVAGHIRSLQVAHATDVASSDRHAVKPWFQGKLDFAPQVPDLAAEGFTLAGGRLDYLIDRPVAALVYRRREHVINVFTWPVPDAEERPARPLHRQGFHIRTWQRAGLAYWAISDLNGEELDQFVQLFRSHANNPKP